MKRRTFTRALWLILLVLLSAWTATVDDEGEFDLSQSLSVELPEMGTVTVHFPGEWQGQIHPDGVLYIASSVTTLAKALTDEADEFAPGEESAVIFGLPQSEYPLYDLAPDATAEDATNTILAALVADGVFIDPQFSSVKSFFANDRPAALITGFARGGEYDYGTVIGVVAVESGMIELLSACNPADTPAHTALMHAIMKQIEFTPVGNVALNWTQQIFADVPMAGTYALSYPEGWHGKAMAGGMMIVTNSEALMDRAMTPGLPQIDPGEVAILVMVFPEMLFPEWRHQRLMR